MECLTVQATIRIKYKFLQDETICSPRYSTMTYTTLLTYVGNITQLATTLLLHHISLHHTYYSLLTEQILLYNLSAEFR